MVKDSNAEALEAKGLYRRAASRWVEVMDMCTDDSAREWVKRRSDMCLKKAELPPVKSECYRELHKAATETQKRMGIAQPDGSAFRRHGKKNGRNSRLDVS